MIITKTPLRLSLGGGGTDLPFFYPKFGGELVSAAFDKYIYVTVSPRKFDDKFKISYKKTEYAQEIDDIKNTRVREALKLLGIKNPLEITTVSEASANSGLGSSSAFLVGVLNALHAYKNETISSQMLAEEAAKIEIDILKEPIGKQDQYATAFGNIISLKINKKGKVLASPINISYETIKKLEKNLHIFYTGFNRQASEVLIDQANNAKSDEENMQKMKHIKEIGIQIKNSLERGDVRKFGKLMNLHWETKKSTSEKMTNSRIDDWYDIAIKNGAIGGKIMGAGGGGFFMFYCDNNPQKFIENMKKEGLNEIPFRFDLDGSRVLTQY